MSREGVDVSGVRTDPDRLTALVLLAVEDEGVSPMIFYRTDCADMALDEGDIDEAFIQSAGAIVITGTHFSKPNSEAAQLKAIRIAKANGARVVFDIDYRPNLWGLAGHAAGFERYVKSDIVTSKIKPVLKDCDLIVGTEEEIKIASGADSVEAALKAIREVTEATIVLKRGAMGCIVYDGPIPDDLEQGIVGQGFPIEVYNVLGAGDAFMSGFLRGWLKGEPHATSATWANACGAFAVSGCSARRSIRAGPSCSTSSSTAARSARCARTRRSTTSTGRRTAGASIPSSVALAIDHRLQLEEMAGATPEKISAFKRLAVKAAAQGRQRRGRASACCSTTSMAAMRCSPPGTRRTSGSPSRSSFRVRVRCASSRARTSAAGWSNGRSTTASRCSASITPTIQPTSRPRRSRSCTAAYEAARKVGRELLIEIICSKHGAVDDTTTATALTELYDAGLKPDWWKLEPQTAAAWAAIDRVIAERAIRYCRGVVVLGLDAPHGRAVRELCDGQGRQNCARLCRRPDDLCRCGQGVVCWHNR